MNHTKHCLLGLLAIAVATAGAAKGDQLGAVDSVARLRHGGVGYTDSSVAGGDKIRAKRPQEPQDGVAVDAGEAAGAGAVYAPIGDKRARTRLQWSTPALEQASQNEAAGRHRLPGGGKAGKLDVVNTKSIICGGPNGCYPDTRLAKRLDSTGPLAKSIICGGQDGCYENSRWAKRADGSGILAKSIICGGPNGCYPDTRLAKRLDSTGPLAKRGDGTDGALAKSLICGGPNGCWPDSRIPKRAVPDVGGTAGEGWSRGVRLEGQAVAAAPKESTPGRATVWVVRRQPATRGWSRSAAEAGPMQHDFGGGRLELEN